MENIKKINFYLSAFETEKKFEEGESNSQLILNDDKINKILNKIFSVYNRPNTFSNINEEEKKVLFTKIKSLYNVYQDEGSVLLGTQEPQDLHWFEKLKDSGNFDFYYWNRYKKYLLVNKHFAPRVIDTLENNTLKNIMSYIGNPQLKSEFSKKGLVMGDVQSGKTMNYIGLMTMAADVGYKCIILLTGTSENLRRQTQERVEEGFIGQDIDTGDEVGVGIGRTNLKLDYSNSKYFNEAKLSQPNPTPSRNTIWDNNLKIIDENGNIADHSATITTKQDRHPNSGNLYFDYPKNKLSKYRFLTPRECFLLMGFDENDYEKIIKNNLASRKGSLFFSRDKMYKLAGNSIVVNVLEQIFDTIVSLDELFFSNKK